MKNYATNSSVESAINQSKTDIEDDTKKSLRLYRDDEGYLCEMEE